MSTVGRGTIVGAPEGTEFITKLPRVNVTASTFMQLEKRKLHVSAPAGSKVEIYAANGKLAMCSSLESENVVSLAKLPVGKYMARLKGANGKVLNQKAITLR